MKSEPNSSLKTEIRKLISDGDLLLVVDRLKTAYHAASPSLYDDIVLLESRLNRLLRDSRKGTIPQEIFDAGFTRVAESLLSVANEVPVVEDAAPFPSVIPKSGPAGEQNSATADLTQQMILGINNLKQISWIELGMKVSRSVGRILTPKGGMATGFLVGDCLLMTNHHVLPDAAVAAQSFVEFNYQQDASGGFLTAVRYALDASRFFTTGGLLDCSVVGVRSVPDKPGLESWGRVVLNPNADPVPSEHVVVIQHPNGGYKQIVLTANYVVGTNTHALYYTTDTMPGSSGSPVFNDSWHVIAIHHAAGHLRKDTAGNTRYVNEGILMSSIRAALGPNWPQ